MRPEIYEKSPIAKRKLLGLPMMTVACALGFIADMFYFVTLWSDPVAAGHDPQQLAIVGGLFVIGFGFYFVMKMIRRSQGDTSPTLPEGVSKLPGRGGTDDFHRGPDFFCRLSGVVG
jgi:hypothetical protein